MWVLLNIGFHGEVLLASRPTPKLEDHPSSPVRDCLFNLFAATLHIGGRSSIRNLRTRHAVVTGTHLSHGPVTLNHCKLCCCMTVYSLNIQTDLHKGDVSLKNLKKKWNLNLKKLFCVSGLRTSDTDEKLLLEKESEVSFEMNAVASFLSVTNQRHWNLSWQSCSASVASSNVY